MKKLSKMTSPSQDSNVWQDLIQNLIAGIKSRGLEGELGGQLFSVFIVALKDGLNGQSRKALDLALKMQTIVNKFEKEGGA